jgi:hypothetical protein
MEGMQNALERVRLPIVAFGDIASKATVDPVRWSLRTATRGRLKVVGGQDRTYVRILLVILSE